MYIYMCIDVCVCIYVYICVCVYYMGICICVCIYMYIYMNVYMLMDPAAADPVSPQFFMPPIYVMIGGAQILLILQILLIY